MVDRLVDSQHTPVITAKTKAYLPQGTNSSHSSSLLYFSQVHSISKMECHTYICSVDDEEVADPDSTNPDLGCIQIEVHRILPGPRVEDRKIRAHGAVMDIGLVHERSKKLGTHCVSWVSSNERIILVSHYLSG